MTTKSHNYFSVNWIDGMDIDKTHFIAQDRATIQKIQQANLKNITPVNFGLLPDFDGKDHLNITLSIDGQNTVIANLNKCRAITYGGHLIHIASNEIDNLQQIQKVITAKHQIKGEKGNFFIVLSINPYNGIPVGKADENENPPRHPYLLPDYKLNIISADNANTNEFGANSLILGKIVLKNKKATLIEEYIPPCTSIQSHEDLKYIYAEISSFFDALEHYSINIIQKIHSKKQTNHLASMVLYLCQNLLLHLSQIIPEFRIRDKYDSPVVMITRLIALSRVIKTSFDVYIGSGKEELLNYLTDWCNLTQGAFEDVLVEMIEVKYQHTDCNQALSHTANFTKLILTLFKKLNELDYIGKKADAKIFVKEEIIAKEEIKNRRSFLID